MTTGIYAYWDNENNRSIYIEKLEKWFKENYPNEKLINEVI